MRNNLLKQIRSIKKKLENSIRKNGLNSPETRKISDKIDKAINDYYSSIKSVNFPSNSKMEVFYKRSYFILKKITEDFGKFPTVVEWNKYAKENGYLSSTSMEYISKLNWNYLKIKVERENNIKI